MKKNINILLGSLSIGIFSTSLVALVSPTGKTMCSSMSNPFATWVLILAMIITLPSAIFFLKGYMTAIISEAYSDASGEVLGRERELMAYCEVIRDYAIEHSIGLPMDNHIKCMLDSKNRIPSTLRIFESKGFSDYPLPTDRVKKYLGI